MSAKTSAAGRPVIPQTQGGLDRCGSLRLLRPNLGRLVLQKMFGAVLIKSTLAGGTSSPLSGVLPTSTGEVIIPCTSLLRNRLQGRISLACPRVVI